MDWPQLRPRKNLTSCPGLVDHYTDLAGIRVYKFKLNKQLTLLGYEYDGETVTLYLLKLGSHENFYRDLKNSLSE